ncbi:hypothetical protein ES703_62017 [subsurface metagenome]
MVCFFDVFGVSFDVYAVEKGKGHPVSHRKEQVPFAVGYFRAKVTVEP